MSRAKEAEILQHFVDWAQAKTSIRALILTSTRSDPAATLDAFSDYDLIGADEEENWTALFETIKLFRAVAIGVGDSFGFT